MRTTTTALAALALAGALTGCGLGTAGGYTPTGTLTGPLTSVPSMEGADLAVGSKNFTEQVLLGKMAVILLQSAGADVDDYTDIPGSASSRQAQVSGQVDFAWEYTGTAWIAYMGHDEPIPDEQGQWEAVAKEDLATNDLVWLKPAPMNNTYGFAMNRRNADDLGITAMSEVQSIPVEQRTFCVESEFANRNDGLQPMLDTYDIPLGTGVPSDNIATFDTGAIYAAVAQDECTFGEVFTTDGRIKALDLTVLEDDRNFFPNYNLSGVVRTEVLDEHPQIRPLFETVSAQFTDEVLITLNARVDVDGEEPTVVAWDWLQERGFVRP